MQSRGTSEEDGEAPIYDEGQVTSPQPGPPSPLPSQPQTSQSNGNDSGSSSKSKRIITLPLIRKRSEHNEGLVSTLEELALHQEELQSIGPILGRTCGKTLKILLLQNNVIERMDPTELKLFRNLEYLNLALNNIKRIEGVGGMEWLRKLDLTLNFVDVDALEESVDELCGCRSLEELFLLGNPCMGVDVIPGVGGEASSRDGKQIGWKGCRAYIVARLPGLQSLDGKEIKRSERILAMQQLHALTSELRVLAEARAKERQLEKQKQKIQEGNEESITGKGYISDEAPTHHNPETRTKLSNELYDQKQAKEKQETASQAPRPKGEKEWEEEHKDMVEKVREREERGREWEVTNKENTVKSLQDGSNSALKKDGGIKQCNQGKYQFWFEEESSSSKDDANDKKTNSLIMRIAIPKHLSTSLIDVDIHPTYVSVIIKSKILRVILPVEVVSDKSVARRSAASGYLELVMPKVDPNEVIVGLGHVRDHHKKTTMESKFSTRPTEETDGDTAGESKIQSKSKRRERLGQSLMKEAGVVESLEIVPQSKDSEENAIVSCDDDDDEPPPLF